MQDTKVLRIMIKSGTKYLYIQLKNKVRECIDNTYFSNFFNVYCLCFPKYINYLKPISLVLNALYYGSAFYIKFFNIVKNNLLLIL